MGFLVNKHPCLLAGVGVMLSIAINMINIPVGLWGLGFLSLVVFLLSLAAGTAGIILPAPGAPQDHRLL